jgi:hypothetical protein
MSTNYEEFIAANQALMDCYGSVPAEQYNAMSNYEQSNLCKNEANKVADFLKSGSLSFSSILAQRINALEAA